ncbi:MAG: hypothetical protein IKG11_09855 [Atopobiaceae bacterium]|nr:hypothetical protein [Atopobiaceae bacterium]
MKAIDREAKAYAIENILVLVMLGSAIALQVLRHKRGLDNRGPFVLRIIEALSSELM